MGCDRKFFKKKKNSSDVLNHEIAEAGDTA